MRFTVQAVQGGACVLGAACLVSKFEAFPDRQFCRTGGRACYLAAPVTCRGPNPEQRSQPEAA